MAVHFPSITDQQINRLRSLIEHQFADQSPTRPQIIEFEGQRFVVKFQRQEKNRSRQEDRKSTRLNSSHVAISYAVFCLKKKIKNQANNLTKIKVDTQRNTIPTNADKQAG